MANIVSAAIFGDGAACVLLSSRPEDHGPELLDEGMYHFNDAIEMMGFNLTSKGLKMVLDIEVPETISAHFPAIINPFLEKQSDHRRYQPPDLSSRWKENCADRGNVIRRLIE